MWKIGKKNTKKCITNTNVDTNTQADHNRRDSSKAVSQTNKIMKDHLVIRLNVNRMMSISSNVRNKEKNIVLLADSILMKTCIGERNRYINGGKVHLKSFPGWKAN